ncbi:MAG: hypothetical protein Q9178_007162 [Gyalolechia marmorata]
MADPLSIAAGVIGILTAAAQISHLLFDSTRNSKDAPQTAQIVLTEVNEISGTLSHLQSFLLGNETLDQSRTKLLQVDQVVTVVSGCVLTFSKLEKLLDSLKTDDIGIRDCVRWARKEKSISGLVQRLQNHKASLSLVLHILNGWVMLSHMALGSADFVATRLWKPRALWIVFTRRSNTITKKCHLESKRWSFRIDNTLTEFRHRRVQTMMIRQSEQSRDQIARHLMTLAGGLIQSHPRPHPPGPQSLTT